MTQLKKTQKEAGLTLKQRDTVHQNTDRRENNEEKRKHAIQELEKLLALACGPDFDGVVEITIPAKSGRLGRLKISYNQHL